MKPVTPERITDFHRSDSELQSFLIFAVAVAGKNADSVAPKVNRMLKDWKTQPFTYLRQNRDWIETIMREYRMGPYDDRMVPAMNGIIDLDLRSCTIADLEAIRGIGPKTSRFFMLHSRPDQEMVVLDVHLLRYCKQKFRMKVPKSTPSGKRYLAIEAEAVRRIKRRFPKTSFAEFDLNAWILMRSKGKEKKK
jgi:thermostable 8-oxoguanine DNA glycosylase